ncbi:MAG: hydrogenase nickel incorporation protein HypB [Oceanospirillaceae bacterium]|nr:hydrogenase nickel incorporation protein HypB [Oceanospirillaceae bacterium]
MCGHCGCDTQPPVQTRVIDLHRDLMDANHRQAAHNRAYFHRQRLTALNLVSSPGAGKTTLLEITLQQLQGRRPALVIEGDQQTELDAARIRATGTPAVQVQTGQACHLDASMVHGALHELPPAPGGLLFIENVGNLICPAQFDLGERARVVLVSVTEGDDKPLKYPGIFRDADLLLITKTDLLPHVNFDPARCLAHARRIRPQLPALQLSATSAEGLDGWLDWLRQLDTEGD